MFSTASLALFKNMYLCIYLSAWVCWVLVSASVYLSPHMLQLMGSIVAMTSGLLTPQPGIELPLLCKVDS